MKRIEEQTCNEILEVSPQASPQEIQRAYERVKETFHRDSVAIYSLFPEEEVRKIQLAIEESYHVLLNEAMRTPQDLSHSGNPDQQDKDLESEKRESPKEIMTSGSQKREFSVPEGDGFYRGRTLKRIREDRGLDLKAISSVTKIVPKILEDIEEESFELLPAQVYVKGFLRAYAQTLRLDPQKVIGDYLHSMQERKKK